jgi:serine protease
VRKLALVVLAVLSLLTVETTTAPATPPPTTIGQAVIGFDQGFLPTIGVGGLLAGLPVKRVSTNGSFLTVAAPNLDLVRQAISSIPGVAYVEDNGLMHALAPPNDARFGEQYGPPMMGFPAAWDAVGFGSTAVTVAVVDSGILKTHQDLTGPRILQGHDYVNNDTGPNDDCGHGTHTAGTVGASTNNSVGVAGMAQVNILAMKALKYVPGGIFNPGGCSGPHDAIAQAIIDAADQGAKVISMSIGGPSSSVLENAVNYAHNLGAILVAAGGNDGKSDHIDYPAAYPNVIAVGALTSSKAKASYSDLGPQLDIAAPGSNVLSTYTGSNNATYASASGTSMATPHVAGALALALGCAPAGTTSATIVNALYSTAEDLGVAGRDNSFGYGLARVDRLVAQICGVVDPPNQNPTAAFTATASGTLGVAVNASTSSDPDGDLLSYAWDFGDGATATGVTASHTYATAGTYTITLTVDDGQGGTSQLQKSFNAVSDPDPSTKTITSGQKVWMKLNPNVKQRYFKILIPEGAQNLSVQLAGVDCTTCPLNADLYARAGSRPTNTLYACRSNKAGSDETCSVNNPAPGYWYLRARWISGAGRVTLTAFYSLP